MVVLESQRIDEVRRYLYAFMLLSLLTSLSCSPSTRQIQTPTPQALAPTPGDSATPVVLADTAFSGRAYVDQNGNQVLDPADPPLPGAAFRYWAGEA